MRFYINWIVASLIGLFLVALAVSLFAVLQAAERWSPWAVPEPTSTPTVTATTMQYGESAIKVQHEMCHAHQHWSINGGAPLLPSDYDLESWYITAEGQSFIAATAGLSWPWEHSAINSLEDFAWTCAYWYLDPAQLVIIGGQARYEWARRNLP